MNPINTAHLLEAALPPIPSELRPPPYGSIRHRIRRRRLTLAAAALGVVALLGAGALIRTPSPSTVDVGGPTSATPRVMPPVSWRVARVDRTDTRVTIFVNPFGDPRTGQGICFAYPNPTATTLQRPDAVVVTVTGTALETPCSAASASTVDLILSGGLGQRNLIDGNDSFRGMVVRDSDLPTIPAPWAEFSPMLPYLDGWRWSVGYSRPGGPSLLFMVDRRSSAAPLVDQPDIMLGSRPAMFDSFSSGEQLVRWYVGELTYQLIVIGGANSLDELRSVIAELTWP